MVDCGCRAKKSQKALVTLHSLIALDLVRNWRHSGMHIIPARLRFEQSRKGKKFLPTEICSTEICKSQSIMMPYYAPPPRIIINPPGCSCTQ
ncbi:hypothetical protein VTI74DRAFT_1051 [Chaetomium olivicolor]